MWIMNATQPQEVRGIKESRETILNQLDLHGLHA